MLAAEKNARIFAGMGSSKHVDVAVKRIQTLRYDTHSTRPSKRNTDTKQKSSQKRALRFSPEWSTTPDSNSPDANGKRQSPLALGTGRQGF